MKFAILGSVLLSLLISILCLSSCDDVSLRKKLPEAIVAEETKNKLEQQKDTVTTTPSSNLYY